MEYLELFFKSIFIENMVFATFLGMCSYLAVSKKVSKYPKSIPKCILKKYKKYVKSIEKYKKKYTKKYKKYKKYTKKYKKYKKYTKVSKKYPKGRNWRVFQLNWLRRSWLRGDGLEVSSSIPKFEFLRFEKFELFSI